MTIAHLRQATASLSDDAPVLLYLDMPVGVTWIDDEPVAGVCDYYTADPLVEDGGLTLIARERVR